MESLGEGFDLAAVASAAGLGGGATGTAAAALAFKGWIMKFVVRTLITALFTGVGFFYLLGALGFEIVASDQVAGATPPAMSRGLVGTESASAPPDAAPIEQGETTKRYAVSSPFRD